MFMLIRYPRKNTPETCYFWSDIKQKPVKRDHLWPACKCALKLLKSMAGFRNDPVKAWSSHFDSRIMILMKNLRPFLVSFVASCPKAPDELNTSKDVITCIRESGSGVFPEIHPNRQRWLSLSLNLCYHRDSWRWTDPGWRERTRRRTLQVWFHCARKVRKQ